MRGRLVLPLLGGLLSLGAPLSAQDNRAAAVQLFDAAEALTKAGRLAEACPKYAESYRLDPQLGALLHYADCLEHNGQLPGAYAAFRDAAEVAAQKNDERKAVAMGRAQALEPRLTRVSIELAPNAKIPGLEVLKDGTVLTDASLGVPIAVEKGEHRIEARAPGYRPWLTSVLAQTEGATEHVVVPLLEVAPPVPPPAVPPPQPPPSQPASGEESHGGISPATWVAGGVAVVGLATGVVFNVLARSANSDAESSCTSDSDDKTCYVDPDDADKRQQSLDAAKTDRTVSYIAFGVGGAAAAVAIVTLVLPHSSGPAAHGLVVLPAVGQRGGGLFMRGSF
jgi:hypothetical protein